MRIPHGAMVLLLAVCAGMPFVHAGYRTPPHPMVQLTNAAGVAAVRRLLAAVDDLPTKYDLRNEDGADLKAMFVECELL